MRWRKRDEIANDGGGRGGGGFCVFIWGGEEGMRFHRLVMKGNCDEWLDWEREIRTDSGMKSRQERLAMHRRGG